MKLAIITNYWKNSAGGGIKTYLVNLVEELKSRGVEVSVIFREGVDQENYKIRGSRFLFSIKAFFVLREIKPDVINSQGTWYCLLAGNLYKKTHRVILIHTFRSEPDKKLPFLGKIFIQTLLNGCNCVTFVSKGLKKKVKEVYRLKFKKTAITYPGVWAKEVSEKEIKEFCERFNIKDNSIVLLVQAFTAYKLKAEGAKLVIKAVEKLKEKYPDIILILTRDGLYSIELKEFAKNKGVKNNVIFTGDVKNPFVPLTICDIFLFPWIGKSGVGNALLEAMCMSKPIIATSVSGWGVSEVIEDGRNGILAEPDVDRIVEKIEYLLKNKEFAEKLGENAKKTAEEKFTWEKTVNKFIEIYEG